MKQYDLLLADADGTILDFETAKGKAIREACLGLGITLVPEQAEQFTRINDEVWRAYERGEVTQDRLKTLRFERFLQWLQISGDAEKMSELFVSALSRQADEIQGAHEFLRTAASRVPVIVVTNGISSVQRSRFALSSLGEYVTDYVISGEQGYAKPDPRMVTAALSMQKVPADRALMLGDEPRSDIAAANAAGVASCWYNPAARENPTPHAPTHEVRSLHEVLQWL